MNEYYKDEEVVIIKRKYDLEAIKGLVDSYLKTNRIGNNSYLCSGVINYPEGSKNLGIRLVDLEGCEPEEELEECPYFDDFCKNLEDTTDSRYVDVPYWYYPK